jgi:3-oxoacyl-[acyl-carrier-protein] synthase II
MKRPADPVVISGVGLICPLGQGAERVWQRMLNADAVAEPIPDQWLAYGDFQSRLWAPLPDIDFDFYHLGRADTLRLDRVSMLSIGACHEALEQACLEPRPCDGRYNRFEITGADPARIGVYIGTGIGGIRTTLATHMFHAASRFRSELAAIAEHSSAESGTKQAIDALLPHIRLDRRFNPLAVTMLMSNAVAAAPAVRFGITGPCRTTTLACASGTCAMGDAFRAVSEGQVDVAIAGAAEYLYDDFGSVFRAYDITGAMTKGIDDPSRANRPFDRDRSGFLFSEGGAAIAIIERASTARARGAKPLAEIAAFAESFDGHDLIAMERSGNRIQNMLEQALRSVGISGTDVDYVNAHGTGTVMNDLVETEVLTRVVGKNTLINSTKALIGHTIGASGAIEAVVTTLSLRDGRVHPCRNLDNPLRAMNFPVTAHNADLEFAISESFAFGGHNACLILRHAG